MKTEQVPANPLSEESAEQEKPTTRKKSKRAEQSGTSRRSFLRNASAAAAATWAVGTIGFTSITSQTAEAKECAPFVNNPSGRANTLQTIRDDAAANAATAEVASFPHPTNGDEEVYADGQFFAGNFSKSLHHNANTALVLLDDYSGPHGILAACAAGTKEAWDAVPAGGPGRLIGPLDNLSFNIEGPDSPGVIVPPLGLPPALNSAGKAAETVELYWEAYCRDVPFINFATNPLIGQAVTDMSKLSDYRGPNPITSKNIFRYGVIGNTTAAADSLVGPYVSQILFRTHRLDGVDFVPMIHTRSQVSDPNTGNVTGPGIDIMTNLAEYVAVENGGAAFAAPPFDPQVRFVRSIRDLGQLAASDTIYSIYFRASIILGALGVPLDPNNPFNGDTRQTAFGAFGGGHLVNLIGTAHKGERHAFYHKWYVHRHARPEAFGNLVDGVMSGRFKANGFTLKPDLHNDVKQSAVMGKIFTYNQQLNNMRGLGNVGSFFLPQELNNGSPTHPSAPAGHAISAGACVTILKAWFDTTTLWSSLTDPLTGAKVVPVEAAADGLSTPPYTGSDGGQMTVLGELNKLAYNISEGRNMSSIHWRVSDNYNGLLMGEDVAIRILNEAAPTYPLAFKGFHLTKFDGTQILVGGNS